MSRVAEPVDESSVERVNAALAQVGRYTCAQIIPVVADSSIGWEVVRARLALWTVILWFLLASLTSLPVVLLWVGVFFAAVIAPGLLLRSEAVRERLTTSAQRRRAVAEAADLALHNRRNRVPEGAAVAVIFVSRFERIAAVVADPEIEKHVGGALLAEVERGVNADLQKSGTGYALVHAVEVLGERLAVAMPRPAAELPATPTRLASRPS